MVFRVVTSSGAPSQGDEILLVRDNWNDWFVWQTQFEVIIALNGEPRVSLGSVKIAKRGMAKDSARTVLPGNFPELGTEYFSIGQTENYYETLNDYDPEFRIGYLEAMRDCAFNLDILNAVSGEIVLHESLMRDIDDSRVRHRFHRLAKGNTVLTPYQFRYVMPADPLAVSDTPELDFEVIPDSSPPTNVHALIGRNGVGKSRCFDFLARTFLGISGPNEESTGQLVPLAYGWPEPDHGFAGMVTVSFSPFDRYGPLVSKSDELTKRYDYVGLIKTVAADLQPAKQPAAPGGVQERAPSIKSHEELAKEFLRSVKICREGKRRDRWETALQTLENDPLFEEINVASFAAEHAENWEDHAKRVFGKLSSGHSVVLLTITKLVELVEESSLVLIDEPESHLHPPLLSAFVRALSDLLADRNGVAIVATHSPVVLQEIPSDCCWILNRSGHESRVDRPEIETFGENVGILTREVFSFEVVNTGFHRMVTEKAQGKTYEQVLDAFHEKLGAEARSLARSLTLLQQTGDQAND